MSANTIVLKGKGHHGEGTLDTAASPGMNIAMAADGDYDPAATAAGIPLCIVKEDALQGKTVDDAYAVDDRVSFYLPVPGDEVQVLVLAGETIAKGAAIGFAASGKVTAAASVKQLQALEAVSAPASDTLIAARVA